MITITDIKKVKIEINDNDLSQEPLIVESKTTSSKLAIIVTFSNNVKYLIVINGLIANGVNKAVTPLSHYKYEGYWRRKSFEDLKHENRNIQRFIIAQGFDIHTDLSKYIKINIVDGLPKPSFLIDDSDIWEDDTTKELFNNIQVLDEQNNPTGEVEIVSFIPKKYTQKLKSGVIPSYLFFENLIGDMQLDSIIGRFGNIGDVHEE